MLIILIFIYIAYECEISYVMQQHILLIIHIYAFLIFTTFEKQCNLLMERHYTKKELQGYKNKM